MGGIEPGTAQAWRALAVVHRRVEAALDRELRLAHDLSAVEYTVLEFLADVGCTHLRMQELAALIGLSNSATTRLVSRLEERGLLHRGMCEDDRRGVWTELTGAGGAALVAARPAHDRILAGALESARAVPGVGDLASLLAPITRR